MNEQLNTFLYPISLTLIFAISCIVAFKRKTTDTKSSIFLALMYWAYFYSLLIGYLGETGYIVAVPHLIRTGQISALCFMPLSFLYVCRTINPKPWKWKQLIHFSPVIIYILDYSAFFLKPASEKIEIYRAIYGTRLVSAFGEGLFTPEGFHITLRYLVMLGYWLAQAYILKKAIFRENKENIITQFPIFSWLKWLTLSQLIIILPPILNLGFSFQKIWVLNQFSAIIASLVQGYFLLWKPEILYGFVRPFRQEDLQTAILPGKPARNFLQIESPPKKESIVSEQLKFAAMREIVAKLEEHFNTNKPFLRQGYGLAELSHELGYSTHQLSYLINHHYGVNFYSLINKHRIKAYKEKLEQHEYRQKTLDAIAEECGFHSRATFIRAFKTQTGVTPSAYIRGLS